MDVQTYFFTDKTRVEKHGSFKLVSGHWQYSLVVLSKFLRKNTARFLKIKIEVLNRFQDIGKYSLL